MRPAIGLCFPLLALYLAATVSGNPAQSNLTLTVESVPIKTSGKSFLQRLNVQVSSTWNKFKCQFYTKATVPVTKMLNVKIPPALEMSNVSNCHQLDVVVSRLTNTSLAEQMASLANGTMANTVSTVVLNTAAESNKVESTSSEVTTEENSSSAATTEDIETPGTSTAPSEADSESDPASSTENVPVEAAAASEPTVKPVVDA